MDAFEHVLIGSVEGSDVLGEEVVGGFELASHLVVAIAFVLYGFVLVLAALGSVAGSLVHLFQDHPQFSAKLDDPDDLRFRQEAELGAQELGASSCRTGQDGFEEEADQTTATLLAEAELANYLLAILDA